MATEQFINRSSLSVDLETRYYRSSKLGGDVSQNAKDVGTDRARTNFINGTSFRVSGYDVHSRNFRLNGVTPGFTWQAEAGQYSEQILKADLRTYGGRATRNRTNFLNIQVGGSRGGRFTA